MQNLRLEAVNVSKNNIMKFEAVFTYTKNGQQLKSSTRFGDSRYEDYTQHEDKKRRELYRVRHKNDNLEDPLSAGSLSWWILWGDTISITRNVNLYRKHFNLPMNKINYGIPQ